MVLTDTKTEKVSGRITHVYIGYDATHGVDISSGIKRFTYQRLKDLTRLKPPGSATADIVQDLGGSSYEWTLKFLSDCRVAFFATDVQVADGNQYAMTPNGLSNKIEYFKVIVPIRDGAGASKTRTFTITNGYALRNHADMGDDQDSYFVYEGDAEYISYSDA
jgi:hypothetical protein